MAPASCVPSDTVDHPSNLPRNITSPFSPQSKSHEDGGALVENNQSHLENSYALEINDDDTSTDLESIEEASVTPSPSESSQDIHSERSDSEAAESIGYSDEESELSFVGNRIEKNKTFSFVASGMSETGHPPLHLPTRSSKQCDSMASSSSSKQPQNDASNAQDNQTPHENSHLEEAAKDVHSLKSQRFGKRKATTHRHAMWITRKLDVVEESPLVTATHSLTNPIDHSTTMPRQNLLNRATLSKEVRTTTTMEGIQKSMMSSSGEIIKSKQLPVSPVLFMRSLMLCVGVTTLSFVNGFIRYYVKTSFPADVDFLVSIGFLFLTFLIMRMNKGRFLGCLLLLALFFALAFCFEGCFAVTQCAKFFQEEDASQNKCGDLAWKENDLIQCQDLAKMLIVMSLFSFICMSLCFVHCHYVYQAITERSRQQAEFLFSKTTSSGLASQHDSQDSKFREST